VKAFGTRDLRAANLPHRPGPPLSPTATGTPAALPQTPTGALSPTPTGSFWARTPVARQTTGPVYGSGAVTMGARAGRSVPPPPRTLSPPLAAPPELTEDSDAEDAAVDALLGAADRVRSPSPERPPAVVNRLPVARLSAALAPTTPARAAGTAYGSYSSTPRLDGPVRAQTTGSPRWGGAPAPACARCAQPVFFAEQAKAIGQLWHRACLRCSHCAGSLTPGRVSEHEGAPYCARCYTKVHGPAGGGYALAGKAGG
jgi:hypothetical protein